MKSLRKKSLVALASATVIAAVAVSGPASASVSWDPASVSPLYSPTGPPDSSGNYLYYAYAPSVIVDGDTTRVWTCQNSESGVIEDDIFGTKIDSGVVVSDNSVLSRSSGAWDSFHVCDPSVIRVDSTLNGVSYSYAMFYLGNDMNASAHNQVGVAVANSLDGPWVKFPDPIVDFSNSNQMLWGAGQPSATTIDADSGTALLFWVEGYGADWQTRTYRAEVDLNEPGGPVVGPALQVTASGLTGQDGLPDWLNNADFAYEPVSDRFFAVREQHPYPTAAPNYIGSSLQVVSIDGASIWGGGGAWTVEATIDPSLTGFDRNHNAGLMRTQYGTLPSADQLSVVFTSACGNCSDSLWQYQLHTVTGSIS